MKRIFPLKWSLKYHNGYETNTSRKRSDNLEFGMRDVVACEMLKAACL